VKAAIQRVLAPLGGIEHFVHRGQRVLLKPNLIHVRNARRGTCTHAAVVAAVAELVLSAGGDPVVGDSPGFLSARRVAAKAGLIDALAPLGVPVVDFDSAVHVNKSSTGTFHDLAIARQAAEADVVINLPKLKTHGQMLLTLAIKNMFGVVVGPRKAQWHLKAGRDRDLFARMLVEVYLAAAPRLNIMDAVIAMQGDGPTGGLPIAGNALLASADGAALDVVATQMVGVAADALATTRAAAAAGAGEARPAGIDLLGGSLDEFVIPAFALPSAQADLVALPALLRWPVKNALTPRPHIDLNACEGCGVCAETCPAAAITERDGRPSIDYEQCIRCFCCQELCPHGAVQVKRGVLLRALSLPGAWLRRARPPRAP